MKIKIKLVNVKSVITKSKLPGTNFVINPYIGCQHACIYCYADFIKRFTGHANEDWGRFVDVKINSSEATKITKIDGNAILIGSVTDPYQQVEAKYKVTRSILKKLLSSEVRLEILTKSKLVCRDIDLFSQYRSIKIGISLNTLEKNIAKKIEPYASSPKARIEAIKQLKKNGIITYLFISPIFPEITNYKEIIYETKDYVDEFLFENLNIRGNNRRKINQFIENSFPELSSKYANIQKTKTYWLGLEQEIVEFCLKNNIKYKMYFFHNQVKNNPP